MKDGMPSWEEFRRPVSVDFLANVFGMSRDTVRKKLVNCSEVEPKRYDFREAARHLVVPILPDERIHAIMKQGDLPPKLQAAYWDGMRKRQLWEIEAGELWRTEKVIETFGEIFKRIKMVVQLFADSVDRESELSPRQRAILIRLSDGLLADMHAELAWMEETRTTGPLLEEEL